VVTRNRARARHSHCEPGPAFFLHSPLAGEGAPRVRGMSFTASQIPSATKSHRQITGERWRFNPNQATMDQAGVAGSENRVMVKDFAIALAVVVTITSVVAHDWSNIIPRPQIWKPSPASHESGRYRSEPRARLTYRPKLIAAFQSLKASAAHLFYRQDNKRTAASIDRKLMEKPQRRKAAVDYFRYRHPFPASTPVRTGGNHRWRELARTAWAKLGVKYDEKR
jgi:hypothetical protein